MPVTSSDRKRTKAKEPMDGIANLLHAAESKRLVLFVGAGTSMAPPTNLPSWRDVNRIVVGSLAAGAAPMLGDKEADNAAALILERHAREKLPPEYQAQVLAQVLGERYFEVLRYLDSDYPNPTHLAIAWLARLGCVRAIITANFDRLIETAFTAVDARLERHFQACYFSALAADLGRFEKPGAPCQLLKLHGSVDDPQTLIDTLAQRKRGFALPVMKCVAHLSRSGHWLFLGFSGLDLEAEPNYLNLAPEAAAAAANTAEFAGEFAHAVDWYRTARCFSPTLGLSRRRWMRSPAARTCCNGGPTRCCEEMRRTWRSRCCFSWPKFPDNWAMEDPAPPRCSTPRSADWLRSRTPKRADWPNRP